MTKRNFELAKMRQKISQHKKSFDPRPSPTERAWANGRKMERIHIMRILEQRKKELLSCTKPDDCHKYAQAIDLCLSDIEASK